jgi:hypothetical protein
MTWTPYNPFQPQSYPLVPGFYLATEDVPGDDEPLTIEAYWTSEGWMLGDPECDEWAYQLDFISAWQPLPPPYVKEG